MEFPYELTDEEMLLRLKECVLVGLEVMVYSGGMSGWREVSSLTPLDLRLAWGVRIYNHKPRPRDGRRLLAVYSNVVKWSTKAGGEARIGLWRQKDFSSQEQVDGLP